MRFSALFLALLLFPISARAWCGGPDAWPYFAATIYEEGKLLPQNMGKAIDLYRSASRSGSKEARCKLAEIYEHGRGVPQDYEEAFFWAPGSGETCLDVFDDVANKVKDIDVSAINERAKVFRSVPTASIVMSCGHTVLSTPEHFEHDIKEATDLAAHGNLNAQINSSHLYGLIFDDEDSFFWMAIAVRNPKCDNVCRASSAAFLEKMAGTLPSGGKAAIDKRVAEWKPIQ
jgi:hypothetical protein